MRHNFDSHQFNVNECVVTYVCVVVMADKSEDVRNDNENQTVKKIRRNKCDLGPDFVAPDGGKFLK